MQRKLTWTNLMTAILTVMRRWILRMMVGKDTALQNQRDPGYQNVRLGRQSVRRAKYHSDVNGDERVRRRSRLLFLLVRDVCFRQPPLFTVVHMCLQSCRTN